MSLSSVTPLHLHIQTWTNFFPGVKSKAVFAAYVNESFFINSGARHELCTERCSPQFYLVCSFRQYHNQYGHSLILFYILICRKKKPQYYYALIQNEFLCRNGFFVFMAEAVCILCF